MDDFTITTRLTKSDYVKAVYNGLYRKPQFIVATILGLYLIGTVVLDYFTTINYYSETPYFETICGIFILLGPSIIVLIALQIFLSNPSFQQDIKYSFNDEGITVVGLTFKSEFLWTHIIKQKEMGKYLILHHNKKLGNFIDKTKLTLQQIEFIKSKVKR